MTPDEALRIWGIVSTSPCAIMRGEAVVIVTDLLFKKIVSPEDLIEISIRYMKRKDLASKVDP
jgi:hypothetical protein